MVGRALFRPDDRRKFRLQIPSLRAMSLRRRAAGAREVLS
jgi:hypothetical protein